MSTTTPADGSKTLFRDSKLGNLANSAVAAVVGAAITWVSDLDFTSGPGWLVTLGPPAAGLVIGWLTSWRAKRYPARSAGR